MKSDNETEKDRAASVLLDILSQSLRLLHPLLPFVTEEIYQKFPNKKTDLLITEFYPKFKENLHYPEEEKKFASLQSLVGMMRTLRSECGITPEKKLKALVRADKEQEKTFKENEELIKLLAGIGELEIEPADTALTERPSGSIGMAGTGFEVFVFIAEAVDTAALIKKFANDLEKDKKYIESLRIKLANEQFISNAPEQLVAEQKTKLEETIKRTEKLNSYLAHMRTGNNK
jgi:valyl-tRNA synthetase